MPTVSLACFIKIRWPWLRVVGPNFSHPPNLSGEPGSIRQLAAHVTLPPEYTHYIAIASEIRLYVASKVSMHGFFFLASVRFTGAWRTDYIKSQIYLIYILLVYHRGISSKRKMGEGLTSPRPNTNSQRPSTSIVKYSGSGFFKFQGKLSLRRF